MITLKPNKYMNINELVKKVKRIDVCTLQLSNTGTRYDEVDALAKLAGQSEQSSCIVTCAANTLRLSDITTPMVVLPIDRFRRVADGWIPLLVTVSLPVMDALTDAGLNDQLDV